VHPCGSSRCDPGDDSIAAILLRAALSGRQHTGSVRLVGGEVGETGLLSMVPFVTQVHTHTHSHTYSLTCACANCALLVSIHTDAALCVQCMRVPPSCKLPDLCTPTHFTPLHPHQQDRAGMSLLGSTARLESDERGRAAHLITKRHDSRQLQQAVLFVVRNRRHCNG
jgi:hypothetical protein